VRGDREERREEISRREMERGVQKRLIFEGRG
jgi:hypothetical protein